MKAIIAALTIALVSASAALASDPIKPDPQLTPGAVVATDANLVCQPGYAKMVRHTSGKLKALIYREYGITKAQRKRGHYEVDHLIPLGLGGADVRDNLWPESRDTSPWNAAAKDRLEGHLHREVCAGRVPIEAAQREMAQDWVGAYRRYLGEP